MDRGPAQFLGMAAHHSGTGFAYGHTVNKTPHLPLIDPLIFSFSRKGGYPSQEIANRIYRMDDFPEKTDIPYGSESSLKNHKNLSNIVAQFWAFL